MNTTRTASLGAVAYGSKTWAQQSRSRLADSHAMGGKLLTGKAVSQLDLLTKIEVERQTGDLCILTLLGGLDNVLQALALTHPGGCAWPGVKVSA